MSLEICNVALKREDWVNEKFICFGSSKNFPCVSTFSLKYSSMFQYCIIYFLDYTNITDKFGKTPIHMLVPLGGVEQAFSNKG